MKSILKLYTNERIDRNKAIGFTILFIVFIISLSCYFFTNTKTRKVLFFQHRDTGVLQVESRYLPKLKKNEGIKLFVDELLLGPMSDRSLPLFPRNTKSISTVLSGKTLYVNLSSEALNVLSAASANKVGSELFRKNVFRNFRNIAIIHIYIEGSSIYENQFF